MGKILIVDTYYPDFLKSLPFNPAGTYESELRAVLDQKFGTADFYSKNLRAMSHECIDVIANHHALQWKWAEENYSGQGRRNEQIVDLQIEKLNPDVVFMQDLSVSLAGNRFNPPLLAGQLSCPWPGDDVVRRYSILYTSFPYYVPRIEQLGVRAVYLPLAFEPSVLQRLERRVGAAPSRIHDAVFIGGVGNPSHWKRGMEVLETVAREIPTFKWWGYGIETLPASSALHRCYQGQAFGLDMYEILLQSKICLNRHGEVAEGYANNMRMYEATGCGAMLLTDNRTDLFNSEEVIGYSTPTEAVEKLRYFLTYDDARRHIAANGQRRTLRAHTYASRMAKVSETLTEMLCPA